MCFGNGTVEDDTAVVGHHNLSAGVDNDVADGVEEWSEVGIVGNLDHDCRRRLLRKDTAELALDMDSCSLEFARISTENMVAVWRFGTNSCRIGMANARWIHTFS